MDIAAADVGTGEHRFITAYISFGVPFRLCSNSPSLLEKMRATVPFGTTSAEQCVECSDFILEEYPDGNLHLLADGEEHISRKLPELLEQLRSSLMVHVANSAADRVFVHAGVVAWHGLAVIFPG